MTTSGFPDWAGFTPEFAAAELPRLLEAAEQAVAAIEAVRPVSYEEFVWKLDDATRDLYRVWGGVSHMIGVMNSDAWRKVQDDFQVKIVTFGLRVGQSRALYDSAKACLKTLGAGPSTRRRIVEKMVEAAEHAGVGLEGEAKDRFNAVAAELAKLGSDFYNAVIDATAAFKFEKDGKTYTIDDANYPETMKHCADREVRETLYRARVRRAPENESRIDEILKLRAEEAKLLGYENYADLSLATKCAPSVTAVFDMIDRLDAATERKSADEEAELEKARDATDGAIEPWDRAYLAERLREKTYAYSEEELKRYFEFGDVLKGLFRMAKFLFGVDVEEVVGAAKPSVWHPDVRFFAVKDGGETIAHFYLDAYVRSGQKAGGAWMNEFRNRSVRISNQEPETRNQEPETRNQEPETRNQEPGTRNQEPGTRNQQHFPLAVLVLNLPVPDKDGRCLMPFREVETLFHEFGHSLQCMLTRIDEEDAAGINLVEWDAVEVASQFMENWCLDDRTGIVVPAELKAKVRAAKNFRAATACRRQLAFAKLDLLLHTQPSSPVPHPSSLKTSVFAHFGLPVIEEDRFLCAFSHIFAGGYAAGYYGYKWAEVMSADCYGAFEEAGLADDAKVRSVGSRYRETILALGGSKSALDVFREFRGRDPEITALLRQQDLLSPEL